MATDSGQIDLIKIKLKPKTPDQLLLLMPPKVEESTSFTSPNMNLFLVSQNNPPVPIPLVQKPYFQSVRGYVSNKKEVGRVCRTCYRGVFNDKFVKLYDDNNKSFSEKLRQMLLEVSPQTDLDIYMDPVMCNTCIKLLFTSYKFKIKCRSTEEKFAEWISQRKGVQKNDVKLLILVESSSEHDSDENEDEDRSELEETKSPQEIQDVVNSVDMDHNYASSVPTKSLTTKLKKKFSFQIKLDGKKLPQRVKRKRVVLRGPFLCDQCGEITDSYRNYKTHLSLHFGDTEKKVDVYKCSQCGYRTKSRLALKKHTRRHNKPTLDCKYSGKNCKSFQRLKFHVTKIHENKRTHLCHICGLKFNSYSLLQKHTAFHRVKHHREWICQKCDEKFDLKKDHARHILCHRNCNTYKKKRKDIVEKSGKKLYDDDKTDITVCARFEKQLHSLKNELEEQESTVDDLDEFQKIENQLLTYFEHDEHVGEQDSSICVDVIRKKIITVKELESLLE